MSTWHQQQARKRAYEAGTPLRFDHPTQWTVRTDPPNRMSSSMLWPTQEQAQQYLDRLRALAADNPNDIERHLAAKHSFILPPSKKD